MDNTTDTLPEHIKLRLIAAAIGLQQCTKTAANIVPLPGTDRFVVIGAPAEVWQLLRRQMLAEESPPNAGAVDAETTLPEDVAAVFAACGFEVRSTDPAEKHPLAVAGSLDAAALVVEALLTHQAPAFDFLAHLARQAAWSEKTFGPGPRTKGVCDHIRKELLEIEADPLDLREWIDVVILALDGAWRCGGTPEQIIAGIVAKQAKNEGRTWPDWRTADPDKAIEHDRSQEGVAS